MNNSQQTIRVGLFFLLGVALAWITFESLSGGQIFKKKGYTLIAPFANLKGLKTGDDILMAGVKIGSIAHTRLGQQRVEAVLSIDPKVQIPSDAVASVETSSLLGSQLGAKLEQVAAGVSNALGGGDGSSSMFSKIDKIVTDNGPKLTETIANLQDITARIKNAEGTIGKLVNDPKLHDELLASVGEIKLAAADARTFMNDAKTIVADVKSGKGTLGVLLYDDTAATNIKATAANLRQISDKINNGQGTLGKLISDDSLYKDVQSTLKKADQMIDGLNDQGPITAVGVAAQAVF
jgi:phospholipid/cholesterol/gamma-HCH transport system substrate-binding protein